MTTDEDRLALSRLALGDLPEAEARILTDRMAREPELAETWRVLQALPESLAQLETERPPTPLVEAVLPAARPRQPAWLTGAAGGVLGLAAGALLTLSTMSPTELTLESGASQAISGNFLLHADDLDIRVSGKAHVVWEPVDDGWRVTPHNPKEDEMTKMFIGAGVGAVVAITVLEGSAWMTSTSGQIEIAAGETRSIPIPHSSASVAHPEQHPTRPSSEPADAAVASSVAELTKRNEALEFENALLRGRLEGSQGVPQEWPEDTPAAYREEALRASLTANLPHPEDLLALDCDEFPCIAFVDMAAGPELEVDQATSTMKAVYEAALGTAPDDFFIAKMKDAEGGDILMVGNAVLPPDTEVDDGLRTRIESRAETALRDLIEASK